MKLSKDQNQNVLDAAEQKPENSTIKEAPAVSYPKPPVLQVNLASLDPNMLKTAESLGIPLTAIVRYVSDLQEYNASVEARLDAIVQNFEPAVQASVGRMIAKAREEVQKQQQAAPAAAAGSPGGGMSPVGLIKEYGPLLKDFLNGGGGGGVNLGAEFQQKLADSLVESALGDFALGKTIRLKVTETLGASIGKSVGEAVVKTVAP